MIREHVNQAYNTCMHINMLSLYYILDLRATQLERQCKGHDDSKGMQRPWPRRDGWLHSSSMQ